MGWAHNSTHVEFGAQAVGLGFRVGVGFWAIITLTFGHVNASTARTALGPLDCWAVDVASPFRRSSSHRLGFPRPRPKDLTIRSPRTIGGIL